MHYCINVFVKPGDSLDDAMAPFEEGASESKRAWQNGHKWDYWSNGGRYDGYWNETFNLVTAKQILSGEAVPRFEQPYGFVTLSTNEKFPNASRGWFERQIYVPGGLYEERTLRDGEKKWGLSYFIDAPHYDKHYQDYLASVPEDTEVYVVDIHS